MTLYSLWRGDPSSAREDLNLCCFPTNLADPIVCITRAEFLKLCHALSPCFLPMHKRCWSCRVDLQESLIRQEGLVPTAWSGSSCLVGLFLSKTFGMRLFFLEGEFRESENELSAKLAKIRHDLWAKYCTTLRTSAKRKDRFFSPQWPYQDAGISIDSLSDPSQNPEQLAQPSTGTRCASDPDI